MLVLAVNSVRLLEQDVLLLTVSSDADILRFFIVLFVCLSRPYSRPYSCPFFSWPKNRYWLFLQIFFKYYFKMGNASARSQPISTLDTVSQYRNYLLEYNEVGGTLVYLGLLGDGKFLKSILVKGHGPNLMLKIYRLLHASESLSSAQDLITTYSNLFSMKETPNCLPYTTAQLSLKSNVAFLGRPYFYASLYDRLQNRPFLSDMEKKWIMYQCFRALEQCVRIYFNSKKVFDSFNNIE